MTEVAIETILVEVSKLELKRDDVLLLKIHGDFLLDNEKDFTNRLCDLLKVKVIVTGDNIEFAIIRSEDGECK